MLGSHFYNLRFSAGVIKGEGDGKCLRTSVMVEKDKDTQETTNIWYEKREKEREREREREREADRQTERGRGGVYA